MDKPFDAELPDAQAGLTCLACHAIDSIHSVGGNADYTLADRTRTPYLFSGVKDGPGAALHDLLVKAKPEVHKRDMLRPFMKTSEFCGVCHKVSLQEPVNDYRWFRGQNEYDSWHNSGIARNNPQTFYLPPTARSCQDCHMPMEDAPLGDLAATEGKIRSHRFLGPNTALPHIRGDQGMLDAIKKFRAGALRVDVFAIRRPEEGPAPGRLDAGLPFTPAPVREGETVELHVVARNLNVGHIFPGGTLDSNQGWMAIEVLGPDGNVLLQSGALDPDGTLPGEAHTYSATIVDRHGKRIDRRNAKDIYVPAQVNVIPPGAADLVRYSLTVPAGLAGREITVRASIKWRKFRRDYTEFAFKSLGLPVPTLPVDVLATTEVRLPVIAAGASLPEPAAPSAPAETDWTRWNDLGIGAIRQGDTALAERAFAAVNLVAPKIPDGPRNLARVKLEDGGYGDAKELLREADSRAPGDARTAWWLGLALARTGDYERALDAFGRVLEVFPQDRNSHAERARALYLLQRYPESLASWLEVLRIDPEDRDAHYNRSLLYGILGGDAEKAAAEKAFDRYRIDPSARERTLEYLQANPDVNREAQPVHVHELQPPAR
jgi:Flp pilus assembly protein TadD